MVDGNFFLSFFLSFFLFWLVCYKYTFHVQLLEYSCKNCNATLIVRTIVPSSVRQGTLSLLCVHDKVL